MYARERSSSNLRVPVNSLGLPHCMNCYADGCSEEPAECNLSLQTTQLLLTLVVVEVARGAVLPGTVVDEKESSRTGIWFFKVSSRNKSLAAFATVFGDRESFPATNTILTHIVKIQINLTNHVALFVVNNIQCQPLEFIIKLSCHIRGCINVN